MVETTPYFVDPNDPALACEAVEYKRLDKNNSLFQGDPNLVLTPSQMVQVVENCFPYLSKTYGYDRAATMSVRLVIASGRSNGARHP